MKKAIVPAALAAALGFSQQVNAVNFDGFLTAGFALHDQEDATYLDTITDDIRFDNDSKFGLQVTADVAENMQAVAQILAAGSDENFDLDIEWAYVDWRLTNAMSLRAGKVKEPVFLISDYIEVGYAYPWIRPPQEVYRNNPITTINGMEALFQTNISNMSLIFQPYIGTNTEAVPGTNGGIQFDASNFFGASLQLASRAFTLQMSFLQTDVATNDLTATAGPGSGSFTPFVAEGDAQLISAGLSWDVNNFVGYTEYVTRDISEAQMEGIFPDQDAWYVTLGYRMGNFLPHITFANSEADPIANPAANQGVTQDSVTLGVRYEINNSATFKFEVQSITPDIAAGSGGLFGQSTVDGSPLLPADFVDGDSATMISAAVDIIF
jgi:predicted porin